MPRPQPNRRRRKSKRGGDPLAIAELVRVAYPGRDSSELAGLHAFRWWFHAVPARVYKRALPVRLRGGILTVHTATSTWASELSFLKDSLLESVRKHAPHIEVRDIRFKVGPLPKLTRPNRIPKPPPSTPMELSELPEPLARALVQIQDDDLRDWIRTAASASIARKEMKPDE